MGRNLKLLPTLAGYALHGRSCALFKLAGKEEGRNKPCADQAQQRAEDRTNQEASQVKAVILIGRVPFGAGDDKSSWGDSAKY